MKRSFWRVVERSSDTTGWGSVQGLCQASKKIALAFPSPPGTFQHAMPAPFQPFGLSHVSALLVLAAVVLLLVRLRRQGHAAHALLAERALGTLLLALWPLSVITHFALGTLDRQHALPLHYCDVAAISGGLALWTRRPALCDVAYFFGLAGTLQGLITPSLQADFPDARFFFFFLWHGGVVAASLHLVLGLRHRPRAGAPVRMTLLTAAYAVLVSLLNALLGTNYGFVCDPPPVPSLIDYLGPWPWYVPALLALGAVFYTLLDLPFWRARIKALQDPPNHV